jgi:GNAT superfamily N-acetyltransferase
VNKKPLAKPKPIQVRAGTRQDVTAIASLIRGLAEYERLAHECHVSPKRLLLHGFGQRRYFQTLVATRGNRNGRPVGFALYFFTYSTFATRPTLYIEDLFVPAEERRAGLGRALLVALARIAVRRGCARMEWAVLDWNEPAIEFYRKLGAKMRKQWVSTVLESAPLKRLARLPGRRR